MPDIFDSEAFCPLAWNGIYIQPDGAVDNCCVSKNSLGNINDQSLEEIIGGDRAISVRKQMLSGTVVPGCKHCYPEKKTKNTHRESLLISYKNQDRSLYESEHNFQLKYVDIRLRNTCNYGCVYCSPELSSTIAQERKQFPILKEDRIAQSIQYFKNNAATIDRIYLAGGEPLLIKENEILLEEIARVNPTCEILVNTNLSQIKNNRIFEILIKLPNVNWLISGEDIGERYEYIRYKGSWKNFSDNVSYLIDSTATNKISFNLVYFCLNSKTIFEFISWLKDKGINEEGINIQWISNNPYWDPRHLSKKFQNEIFEIMDQFPAGPVLRNSIDNIKIKFQPGFKEKNQTPLAMLKHFDNLRNLDSQKIFPEIYQDLTTLDA